MRIETWSDVICPWCAIGRARLRKAIAQAGVAAQVIHRAFELDPDRRGTVATHEFLAQRYGSRTDVHAMTDQVRKLAAAEGLDLQPGRALAANTFDAHRLILWAQQQGHGEAMMDRLVHAHFSALQDVSDREVLVEAAAACGLARGEAGAMLASPAFGAQVREDEALARELGVRGVPFFVLADTLGVSGAQPVEVFVQALRQVQAAPSGPAGPG